MLLIITCPELGLSISPAIFKMEVFPDPEGPIKAIFSPFLIFKSILEKTFITPSLIK